MGETYRQERLDTHRMTHIPLYVQSRKQQKGRPTCAARISIAFLEMPHSDDVLMLIYFKYCVHLQF